MLSFQDVLREVRDGFLQGDNFPHTPAQINNGFCADFATIVWEKMGCPSNIRIVSDEDMGPYDYTHTFIEYEDMYYDAECIEGVEDWDLLPVFQR